MDKGWILIHRPMMNKWYYKDSEALHLWIHLLLKAYHTDKESSWNGKIIIIKRGSFITGRNKLARETGINESKVYRLLSRYETEQQIEQQHCSRNSIITITNYDQYQKVNSGLNKDRTASEQPVNTNKQLTNLINEKNNTVLEEIQEILTYLNEATGRDFNLITVTNQYEIKKRLAEGFKVEDFKTVVDNMVSVWAGKPEKTQYFRPQTLFGENFDAYRQAKKVVKKRLAPNQMM